FLMIPPPPRSTLFPYTTLFRSRAQGLARAGGSERAERRADRHRAVVVRPGAVCQAVARAGARGARLLRSRVENDSGDRGRRPARSEEHTSELQSRFDLVCRLLL